MRAAGLTYVRTSAGTVKLHEGDTVPAEADEADVKRLVASGALVEGDKRSTTVPTPPKPPAGGNTDAGTSGS